MRLFLYKRYTKENTMKDLYNIAGILPAQFRSSPVDCGIAFSEHRKGLSVNHDPKGDAIKSHYFNIINRCAFNTNVKSDTVKIKFTGGGEVELALNKDYECDFESPIDLSKEITYQIDCAEGESVTCEQQVNLAKKEESEIKVGMFVRVIPGKENYCGAELNAGGIYMVLEIKGLGIACDPYRLGDQDKNTFASRDMIEPIDLKIGDEVVLKFSEKHASDYKHWGLIDGKKYKISGTDDPVLSGMSIQIRTGGHCGIWVYNGDLIIPD
jgi:hypothetical protein